MDALIAQAIQDTTVLRKTSVSWEPDQPHPQSYYAFDATTSSWIRKSPSGQEYCPAENKTWLTKIAVYSWNIDFMLPFAESRMKAALAHLESLVSSKYLSSDTGLVIFLQECRPFDLVTIATTPWVRERFHISDLDHTNWATTHYGTVILVDSRLPITATFRVHYSKTRMDRDALFMDLSVGSDRKKVRVCNTHLESMAFEPPFRPFQMQLIAGYLHDESVHAALVAGDFNAIQPADRTLHVDGSNGLKDVFLQLGGKEDTEEGYTWGQQAATKLRQQFGCSRMDKVFYCGSFRPTKFERFGEDILVEEEEESKEIVELGFEKPWVTDHLGIMVEMEILGLSTKV
ncbi:Endonuclease/exonuclease/phosphatase [Penicillium macrosclerotiorum]|uniref:Endonuclease/exonuclease/phosphatase n=1 Tax=Penicillium macrosclerotiorum TaxID=303699 RepID=UPI002549AC28|nr:Endonuclease/exonuclease/phosphatase [Penicillium macrosclerotiorum]KAJ5690567.1 Endonuclease/exonuclease/phosphatase [Penicillium macrosclerotiorum]